VPEKKKLENTFEEKNYSSKKNTAKSKLDLKYELVSDLKKNKYIILAKHLIKDYEIGDFIVRAVDDVSIKIKFGEFVVIQGPSGAGKTTLLNLIGGLDKPNKGGIIFNQGVNITNMEEESLANFRLFNSGFIFQNYNLISSLTAEENVIFPMTLSGMLFKKARERAVSLLKKIGLSDRREHLPFQLSAGEQQRVAIARALANDPPIILADEPTANLDNSTSQFIRDLFKEMKKDDKTIIIVTHDNYLIDLANKIITFNDGKITQEIDVNQK